MVAAAVGLYILDTTIMCLWMPSVFLTRTVPDGVLTTAKVCNILS